MTVADKLAAEFALKARFAESREEAAEYHKLAQQYLALAAPLDETKKRQPSPQPNGHGFPK